MSNNIKNKIALSIDVEDWFTVRNMRTVVSESDWDRLEIRVNKGMDFILDELLKRKIKATFFVLGWVVDKAPQIVKRIVDEGHEIATHGYGHVPIDLLTPESFEDDLKKSINSIKSLTGIMPRGYRAPSFSITKETFWAIDILKKNGIEYDSSIFPITHPDYGIADFEPRIQDLNGIVEVPIQNSHFLGFKLPVAGGGYFRLLPYIVTKMALKRALRDHYMVMYFHPWEFDETQPRMKIPTIKRFRHYVGLNRNKAKFRKLLDDFSFVTMSDLISSQENPLPKFNPLSLN